MTFTQYVMGGQRRCQSSRARSSLIGSPSRVSTRCGAISTMHAPWDTPRHGTDTGDARPAHALGSRVVRPVQRVLATAARHDGHAPRPDRSGLPAFPPGRADRDDRRLPRHAPGACRGRAASGARREALGRSLVHADGRVPHVRRVAHPQPRARTVPGPGARARAGGRVHAGPVRPRGTDAADPSTRRCGARGGVARRAGLDRSRRVLVGVPRREPRPHRVHGVRLLQRGVVREGDGTRGARRGVDRFRRTSAAVHGERSGAGHGRVRPRRTRSVVGRAPRRGGADPRRDPARHRRPGRPPGGSGDHDGPADVAR